MQPNDKIRINQHRNSKVLEATVTILSFIDKDTNQYIKYVPSLDLSAYGKNENKAQQMLEVCLNEELNRVIGMSDKQAKAYLAGFGWKVEAFHNKNLSHIVVDKHGALQGFNVDIDSVKEEQVSRKELLEVA